MIEISEKFPIYSTCSLLALIPMASMIYMHSCQMIYDMDWCEVIKGVGKSVGRKGKAKDKLHMYNVHVV